MAASKYISDEDIRRLLGEPLDLHGFSRLFGQASAENRPAAYHLIATGIHGGFELSFPFASALACGRRASMHEDAAGWAAMASSPSDVHATIVGCILHAYGSKNPTPPRLQTLPASLDRTLDPSKTMLLHCHLSDKMDMESISKCQKELVDSIPNARGWTLDRVQSSTLGGSLPKDRFMADFTSFRQLVESYGESHEISSATLGAAEPKPHRL